MKKIAIVFTLVFFFLFQRTAFAQSTEFSYQGQLQNASALANGVFDFEFALFGSAFGGGQLGSTQTRSGVNVANGIFSVALDFGNQFDGTPRFLEIRVRQPGGGAFTTLLPRQSIASSPYAVRSLDAQNAVSSQTATTATSATTANNFTGSLAGDVTGTQGSTTVARLRGTNVAAVVPSNGQVLKFNSGTNQWQPDTDNTGAGGGGTITGVTTGTGLTGGGTTGNVTVGIANGGVNNALLADGSVNTPKIADASVTNTKIVDISGSKITGSITTATIPGSNVTGPVANATSAVSFSGPLAGDVTGTQAATAIANNAVTDPKIAAGQVVKSINTLKDNVTLAAGTNITITPAGNTLTIASSGGAVNAILNQTTQQAGANFNISGTGTANILAAGTRFNIGADRVLGAPGTLNLFAGVGAGGSNTSGDNNAIFGADAGKFNSSGHSNSFFGTSAGFSNTTAWENSFFGTNSGSSNTIGLENAFFGYASGNFNTLGGSNAFFGWRAGRSNTTASFNSFFGSNAGSGNTTGDFNAFFGRSSGAGNTTGNLNSFFGARSGESNTTGTDNAFFGTSAGFANTNGNRNSFFGRRSGESNITGVDNSFFGYQSGLNNTDGSSNSFLGRNAGINNVSGVDNSFVGYGAGTANTTGFGNTIIGSLADVASSGLTNASAIGFGAIVSASNKIRLGNSNVTVIEGQVAYTFTSDKNQKENFLPVNGREVLRKIRGFNMTSWNYIGQDPKAFRHYGPMAQDFYAAFGRDAIGSSGSPTTINTGDMSGVMLTAIKELSTENEQIKVQNRLQQKQIDQLKQIVCTMRPRSAICRKK